jgi:cyanophycinase
MAPGLGLLEDVIIDQHFMERGRMGRLLSAVAHNPRLLGIGLNEDTAILVHQGKRFEAVGSSGVYVVDARGATESNVSELTFDRPLSIFGVTLHFLGHSSAFDLEARRPIGLWTGAKSEPARSRNGVQTEGARRSRLSGRGGRG